jgi:hypothetical protein
LDSHYFIGQTPLKSKKRTKYTSAFKTKLVLELLQNKSTLVQIASKHNILPQNLQNWKKKPLEIYQTERGVDYYLFVDESGTHVIKKI